MSGVEPRRSMRKIKGKKGKADKSTSKPKRQAKDENSLPDQDTNQTEQRMEGDVDKTPDRAKDEEYMETDQTESAPKTSNKPQASNVTTSIVDSEATQSAQTGDAPDSPDTSINASHEDTLDEADRLEKGETLIEAYNEKNYLHSIDPHRSDIPPWDQSEGARIPQGITYSSDEEEPFGDSSYDKSQRQDIGLQQGTFSLAEDENIASKSRKIPPRKNIKAPPDAFSSDEDEEFPGPSRKKLPRQNTKSLGNCPIIMLILFSVSTGLVAVIWISPYFKPQLVAIFGEEGYVQKEIDKFIKGGHFPAEKPSTENELDQRLNDLKEKFPGQREKLRKVVKAALSDPLYEEKPAKPGILLLASDDRGIKTSRCVAEYILLITDKIMKGKHIRKDLSELSKMKSDDVKDELHKFLKQGFEKKATGALLLGLQHLSGHSAMALKAFTDDQNALFKKTVIVSTLETLNLTQPIEPTKWDESVMDLLSNLWDKDLGASKSAALANRVANNIVVVQAEDTEC